MHDVRSDEAWAQGLAARVGDVTPVVPVDVPGAVRRGRRRRVARALAGATGALAVLAVGVLAVPQLVRPDDAAAPPAAEVVGFTRAVEEVDGQEREVATLDGDDARAAIEAETAARAAQGAQLDVQIAATQALVAELDGQMAALGGAADGSAGDATRAERAELTTEREAAQARLDGLAAQRDAQVNLEYATWVAEQYDLTDLPQVAVVERVPTADWSARIATCLTERGGWEIHVAPPAGRGWSAHYDPADASAFGADLYTCAAMYPAELAATTAG